MDKAISNHIHKPEEKPKENFSRAKKFKASSLNAFWIPDYKNFQKIM